jgi:DNA-binding IclR family transcriptional regulator
MRTLCPRNKKPSRELDVKHISHTADKLSNQYTSGMPRDSNGSGGVAVLAKATALLDHMAAEGEVTPARLAELTGEPRSTVYRLLASLQQLELVEPGRRKGTYLLGLKLFRLGATVVSRFDARAAAQPVMERIHEETGETVFLCIRRGYEAVCIERLDGRRVNLLALGLGGSLPLHAGAVARTLLAFEPPEFWEEYLEQWQPEALTSRTPATREALLDELRITRERGYAISDEDVTPGVGAVGAPVFDHTGAVQAALSFGGMVEFVFADRERSIALALDSAAEVSRTLGYDGRRPS